MKDPDLSYCLRKAQDAYFHLVRASDTITLIGAKEGGHYLDNALKHIWNAKDMLNRYREFIKEDYDEEDICGTGDTDAERDAGGVRA